MQVNNNPGFISRAEQVLGAARPVAWLGALSGVVLGIKDRALEGIHASAHSSKELNYLTKEAYLAAREVCKAGPSHPLEKTINSVMQFVTKGALKFIPVVLPVLIVGGKVAYKTVKDAPDWKVKSVWNSFKMQVSAMPARDMVNVVALTAMAGFSPWLLDTYGASLPSWFIGTLDPSGHVMMTTVIGLATCGAAGMLSKSGLPIPAALTSLTAVVTGVANSIFVEHTVGYCHSMFEVYDGLKWAAAIWVGATLTSKVVCSIASKVFSTPDAGPVQANAIQPEELKKRLTTLEAKGDEGKHTEKDFDEVKNLLNDLRNLDSKSLTTKDKEAIRSLLTDLPYVLAAFAEKFDAEWKKQALLGWMQQFQNAVSSFGINIQTYGEERDVGNPVFFPGVYQLLNQDLEKLAPDFNGQERTLALRFEEIAQHGSPELALRTAEADALYISQRLSNAQQDQLADLYDSCQERLANAVNYILDNADASFDKDPLTAEMDATYKALANKLEQDRYAQLGMIFRAVAFNEDD